MPVCFRDDEDLCDTTCSESSFCRASKWIADCTLNHHECSQVGSSSWFPTRVLDVSGDPNWVRIQISRQEHLGHKYLTLSHCWGGTQTTITKLQTLPDFVKGIRVSSLPTTYRDAIDITRRLGYRYLWIDSLCIIQDSDDDWKQECAVMSQVYKYSECTIAATGSANSHGGCFVNRNALELQPCKIVGNILSPHNEDEEMYIYKYAQEYIWEEISGSLWNNRGWILQERILSPRVLHYARRQLFWECPRLNACESFPQGLSVYYNNDIRNNFIKEVMAAPNPESTNRFRIPDSSGSTTKDILYSDWQSIIETYSSTNLTKSQDKLVAISGLAREWSTRIDEKYCAGIWRGDLHRQLLWQMEQLQEKSRKRIIPYRAPTWSWACFDHRIYNPLVGEELKDCISIGVINRIETVPTGSDPMGTIGSGFLEMKARAKTGNLSKQSDGMYCLPQVSEGYNDEHIEQGGRYSNCIPDIDLSHLEEVTCLPLLAVPESGSEPTLNGLMLIPVRGEIRDQYERVGIFQLMGEHACTWFHNCPEKTITIV